jgi:hypothetical protein
MMIGGLRRACDPICGVAEDSAYSAPYGPTAARPHFANFNFLKSTDLPSHVKRAIASTSR